MHADELRMAVTKIVEILEKAEIRSVIDQYRLAKGDQRTAAAARLGHAGAVIMERIDAMSASERQVTRYLHLESLGSADYWQGLLGNVDDPKKHQAEIVRLASRVMFASSHLPALINLMGAVKTPKANPELPLAAGEGQLCIRLTDAGERASDPDRVARAIDGVDMLYSACASIARKPAIDLRLDTISAKRNGDRDVQLTGERDSTAAVYAVIDSLPAALADIDPDQDINLDAVVQSLPIFADLNTLASLGTFSKKDLKDISDTMHQGALLTLESGIILLDTSSAARTSLTASANDATVTPALNREQPAAALSQQTSSPSPVAAASAIDEHVGGAAESANSAVEHDEHYDRYLREREAMLQPKASSDADIHSATVNLGQKDVTDNHTGLTEDQNRREAVDDLLKSLGQSRSS